MNIIQRILNKTAMKIERFRMKSILDPGHELIKLNEDDFWRVYKPIAKYEGDILRDHRETLQFQLRHVWSVVDGCDEGDENMYALPGYSIVNNIGYLVTEKAWPHYNIEAVYFDAEAAKNEYQ